MSAERLMTALQTGGLVLPESGQIAVFSPASDFDLTSLPKDRVEVVQGFYPDHAAFAAQGFACVTQPNGPYAMSIVCIPRAKAETRALIAAAQVATPEGIIVVDGQKTDGIDSVLKDIKKRGALIGSDAKRHGKIAWFNSAPVFDDWAQATEPQQITGGYVTAPGVFSADAIDPASALLAAHLPAKMGKTVADLGAGWGYLSAQVADVASIESLHLVEAEAAALECARQNVTDGRARFSWDDATQWGAAQSVDTVIMNPPFHTRRAPDPSLGRAFIANAARILKPNGTLWMVANRHLPYEPALAEQFGLVQEIAGDNRFKVFKAVKPRKSTRR